MKNAPDHDAMKTIEYRLLSTAMNTENLGLWLNKLGKEGWQALFVTPTPTAESPSIVLSREATSPGG